MKGFEITGENLEDLLAYDDLFLDFFNAFLSLPVFPQALVYNRLTGAFEELDEATLDLSGNQGSLLYGPTDAEREKMLEWARRERLPLFLKTQLFRELKLVKLLLRPTDDRNSASRCSSRNIRGYSRQTETYVSSLSNSMDNSGHDVLEDDFWGEVNYSALYHYERPGSRAFSMPIKIIHNDDMIYHADNNSSNTNDTSSNIKRRQKSSSSARSKSIEKQFDVIKRTARTHSIADVMPATKSSMLSSHQSKGPVQSSTEEAFQKGARALSAPISYEQYQKLPHMPLPDFDAMFGEEEPEPNGQTYVTFEDDHISDEQTETDVRNMEGRLKMTIQQMKEQVFSCRTGYEHFREFLVDTSGHYLMEFWLDCEHFKDLIEDLDDTKQWEIVSMLFRDIQDKYKLKLTQDAKEQITRSASSVGLSHTIFLRTQYDVLRRLRAYWLPRYLIHCERTDALSVDAKALELHLHTEMKRQRSPQQFTMFPTISLAHSMPVFPEEAKNFSFSKIGTSEARGNFLRAGSSMSMASAYPNRSSQSSRLRRSLVSAHINRRIQFARSSKERFLLALALDRIAGGPFQQYLSQRQDDEHLLSCLLFWQDVTEFGATEDHSVDRLLRLCHAWSIYNRYLSEDSVHKVELSEKERLNIHKMLQAARNFIEAAVFDTAKVQAVVKLEKEWIQYLKKDLKAFLDCRVRVGGESPPSTADAIEITVTDQDVLIKRPRPWVRRLQPVRYPGSGASERAKRLQKALIIAEDIDDERKAERKREGLERRKEMERERRKAIKAAYARQKEAKKNSKAINAEKSQDNIPGEEKMKEMDEKPLTYHELSSNRQVMSMFRKYLNETDAQKDIQPQISLLQDIETFMTSKDSKQKKEAASAHIFKTYLDPHSKKFIPLNEDIVQMVTTENDRPKSNTLKEVQKVVLSKVEETFKEFLSHQAEEFGVEPQELANMSQAELTLRTSSDQSLLSTRHKRKGASRGKHPSEKQDKNEEEKGVQKIGTLEFTSVKVNLFEGGQVGKFSRPLPSPVTKSPSKTMSDTKVKFVALNGFTKIPESRVSESSQSVFGKGDSQSTPSRLASVEGQPQSSRTFDTPLLSLPSQRRSRRNKVTGRAQPSREDKNEFLHTLAQSAAGQLSIFMLYFYKYILKHGEVDGMPQIHKDLFFYIEVQKFKDCSHAYSDEEMLKRKVQSIMDCFLESVYSPPLQIDISPDIHQKTIKAVQRYLAGKDVVPSLFDEAQVAVFKELLPYWAGFRKSRSYVPESSKKPVTKFDKMLRRRMENIQNYQIPSTELLLPSIPEGAIPTYTITLSDGIKYRDKWSESESGAPTPTLETKHRERGSRLGNISGTENLARQGRKMSIKTDLPHKDPLLAR
ncbi:regulator of G-protein signaling 22-like isoform X2 [Pomacea canaliculata]|uniref:regulator of G-protein signaling 22-like isoform X2 n=1 Tax=Pomacea canaliculata TaxID=400727 RepID=UPI000D72F6FF|nr:regulator of G-protein signaling 22-like isoform X2 [Pomacea canaliculata]